MKKLAFTLAEVLITLGIIGVVAALTLPNLIANYQDKVLVTGWKKSYAEISNAAIAMQKDDIDIRSVLSNSGDYGLALVFANYINHLKVCDVNRLVEDGCSPKNYPVSSYSGVRQALNIGKWGGGSSCILITNGTIICFDSVNIYVDVNGYKKPNTVGKDIFAALVNPNDYQVRPAVGRCIGWGPADDVYIKKNAGDGKCNNSDLGFACSSVKLWE